MSSRPPPISYSLQKLSLSPLLVGRAEQLHLLDQLLDDARQGKGRTILVGGEAGIGKTRLLDQIKTHAQSTGFRCLYGNCFEPDRRLPFAPFVDLVRNYFAPPSHIAPAALSAALTAELIKLAPDLASNPVFLTNSPEDALKPSSPLEPEQEKQRLFQALFSFLIGALKSAATAGAQSVVLIEDLHWSDETSLDFLLYCARQINSQPVVLLATYRSDEMNAALQHLLAELDRQRLATDMTLEALTREETGAMIRAIFDLPQPVRAEFLDRIYALTEGNPFFVEETLQSLIASGEIYHTRGQWERKPVPELNIPRSIQDAVQRRIDPLGEPAQHLLALAAVMGRRFDFGLLQMLTDMNESELLPLVKQCMSAQLIVEESADQFAFRHALTRETVYASLLRRERRAMHQRVAETLERVHAAALVPYIADLAYHYHAAELWDKALTYARRAGDKAQQLYAPHEAIEQFSRAVEAAEKVSAPVAALLHARGQAYETIGEFERARADYERALVASRAAGDRVGEWQALLDLGFLWASRDYARTGDYLQQALTLARALDDRARLAHTLNRVGNWHVNLDQPQPALQYHQEALTLFRQADDRNGIAETLDLLGLAYEILGDVEQAYLNLSESVKHLRELGNQPQLVSSLTELSSLGETYLGNTLVIAPLNYRDMVTMAEQARALARQIGIRSGEAYALAMLGLYHSYYGDYDRALQFAGECLQLTEDIEHVQWNCFAHNLLGWIYLDLHALDDARQESERALSLAQQIGSSIFVHCTAQALAATYLAQRELQRAEGVLHAAVGANPFDGVTYTKRIAILALADLALAKGDPTRALDIADELVSRAANLTDDTVIPRLWLLRGEALTQLKRFDDAERVLTAARATADARGVRPLLWQIHRALGKLYQVQDRRKDADVEYSAARSIVQALAENIADATLRETYLRGTDALLPRPRALTPRRAEKARFGGLTNREREIAALIAAGKSNREIAERLVLSERTVVTHITSILNKLGFTSRTQIAVWANEHGLVPPSSTSHASEN